MRWRKKVAVLYAHFTLTLSVCMYTQGKAGGGAGGIGEPGPQVRGHAHGV